MKKKYRNIVFYRNYFEDFFLEQSKRVKAKIIWTIQLIEEIERIPAYYLKSIIGSSGLYELRVHYGSNAYRIFCFFKRKYQLILINGFQKKTNKIPHREIERARKIKEEYERENR